MTGKTMKIGNRKSEIGNRSGFTILEVLLAIGILALSITAVLFLFAMGMRSHRRALDRTRAAALAETVVSQLQTQLATLPPHDTDGSSLRLKVGDANPSDYNLTHPDFPGYYYNATLTPVPPAGKYYRLVLTIRWGDPGAPPEAKNSETFETVLQPKSF